LDDIADQLADWLEDEGVPKTHVVGHSLGGAVAARLAARHPPRIDRLVLVDAAIRPRGTRAVRRPAEVARTIGRSSPQFVPLLVRDLLRCHPRSFVAAAVDALEIDWERHLRQITAPTLVVWGERDAITPLALGHEIAAVISDARLITLAETGHNPMWDRADAFNAEVLRFLAVGTTPENGD
jgi:pimeloyl-ACP methyl ester carboxylesterase